MTRMHSQRGATLLVALIMLVLLTLFAVSALNTSTTNMKVIGNMQTRTEALNAAQWAIEKVTSVDFTIDPPGPQPSTWPVDINNDGTTDYNVVVAKPTCISIVPIKTIQLDVMKSSDAGCFGSSAVTSGGIVPVGGPGAGGNSLCLNRQWDVQAGVTDPLTGAQVTVHQGVSVRVEIGKACPT